MNKYYFKFIYMFTREQTISSFQESFLSELEVDRIISSCNYGLSKMT